MSDAPRGWSETSLALLTVGGALLVLCSGELFLLLLAIPHALAHVATARLLGIPAALHLGWGPVIREGPSWRLAALPGVFGMPEVEAFIAAPLWKRWAVLVAGPLATFFTGALTAWLAFALAVLGTTEEHDNSIGWVPPETPAAAAGLLPSDRIVSVDGVPTPTRSILGATLADADRPSTLQVERQGTPLELILAPSPPSQVPLRELDDLGLQHGRLAPLIGVDGPDVAASRAGLRSGDRVIGVGGEPVDDWLDVSRALDAGARVLTVERDGERLGFRLPDHDELGLGPLAAYVDELVAGGAAEAAGVVQGDRLVALDGHPLTAMTDMKPLLARWEPGTSVRLTVARGSELRTLELEPFPIEETVGSFRRVRPIVGVIAASDVWEAGPMVTREVGPAEAAERAATHLRRIGTMFWRIFRGTVAAEQTVAGQVQTATAIASTPDRQMLLNFLALSIVRATWNLTLWNLLPLPWSDGLAAASELSRSVFGRPLPTRWLAGLGLLVFGLLVALIAVNDLVRLLSG